MEMREIFYLVSGLTTELKASRAKEKKERKR